MNTPTNTKPKRPVSSFFAYMRSVRNEFKQKYPDLKPTELAGLIGQAWKELPEESKSEYKMASEQDKLRYTQEMENFKKSANSVKSESESEVEFETKTEAVTKSKKTKKTKKPKNQIKKARTSYIFYSMEQRPILHKENPDLKTTEITKLIAQQWKSLSEESKMKYIELSKQDKERHQQEMSV